MPEVARKTAVAIEEHAIKNSDMADLPVQRAGNPADTAGACARFSQRATLSDRVPQLGRLRVPWRDGDIDTSASLTPKPAAAIGDSR